MSREFYNSPVKAIRHLRETVCPASLDPQHGPDLGSPLNRLTPEERQQVYATYMLWYNSWVRPAIDCLERRVCRPPRPRSRPNDWVR